MVATDAAGRPHSRYEDLMPMPGMIGDLADMAMYAGQSAELVRDVRPAADLVRAIAAEAEAVVARIGGGYVSRHNATDPGEE